MLLREIVRSLRHEVNLVVFCHQLMIETRNRENNIKDFDAKERLVVSVTDILTLAMFISISPAVREAVNAYHRMDDKRDLTPFKNYLKQIGQIQSHALWWFHEVVPRIYHGPNYAKILHKVLFSAPQEEYYNVDGWPGEGERHVYFKAIAEIPLFKDTLMRIFAIGLGPLPLNGRDTIGTYRLVHKDCSFLTTIQKHLYIPDLVDVLVKKAASLRFGDNNAENSSGGGGNDNSSSNSATAASPFPILECDKPEEMFERLFALSSYTYPETIALPSDYKPPSMAIATAYWKVWVFSPLKRLPSSMKKTFFFSFQSWIILVFYVAHNPSVFGPMVWESFPTLRAFMEMCITSQFVFPPPTLVANGAEAEITKSKELQVSALEKQAILTFEKHLAAATSKDTITEANSLLLPQLTTRDPTGPLRKPPQQVLDLLRTNNATFKLGHLLCRSRNPDFLLDILQRQGTNQEMPWLADLVESSEGSLNALPVQCLCEFLLNSNIEGADRHEDEPQSGGSSSKEREAKRRKQKQLLLHLQKLLQQPDGENSRASGETLDYFLRRLASQQTIQRSQALKGLRKVLTPIQTAAEEDDDVQIMHVDQEENEDSKWLLQHLPALPCFREYYPHIASSLRSACQVENDPNVVGWYLQFLAHYPPEALGDLADLCLDMASIIVERSTILPAILPGSLCKSSNANETFVALMTLFNKYMQMLMEDAYRAQQEEWTREHINQIITVVWSSQSGIHPSSVTLHFFVVHAQIILLTFKPVGDMATTLFRNLLNFWFPSQGGMPRAYYALPSHAKDEIQEEAQLIPDWLKLKMIRSDVPTLVDAALRELDPQQLVLFIQSFGIPVDSMSKLLSALDSAAVSDLSGVSEAVMDKTYMGQLVAVQHRRGASGGKTFAEGLHLDLASHAERGNLGPEEGIMQIGRTTPPIVPPRSTALIPPSQVKTTLLHIFDVGSPGRMTMKEKQDTFRTLQKFLTAELRCNGPMKPMLDATVKALEAILKSDLKEPFVSAAVNRTAFSCGLYRLVSTALLRPAFEGSTSRNVLLKVSESLVQMIQKKHPESKSPLITLLNGFVSKIRGEASGSSGKTATPTTPVKKKRRDESEQDYQELKRISSTDKDFEKHVKEIVEKALKKRSTKSLVNAMSRILLEEEHLTKVKGSKKDQQQQQVSSGVKAKAGLFVDWLGKLDPELVQSNPEVQQQLLFSKSILAAADNKRKLDQTCQPYLLTMLTHQASWSSLRKTIQCVLGSYNPELEPSSVLDFLTACIYIPKLWHGRDKHKPKHETPPDVLALSGPQLLVMIDYHLQEILEIKTDDKISDVFKERMPLIMRCLSEKHKARSVVEYLYDRIATFDAKDMSEEETATEKAITQEFLLQIYMKIPHSILHLADPQSFLPSKIMSSGNSSTVDSLSHTLLSALAATQHGRQWAVQMQDFESAARKVASCHPLLMLRNLPLIAASLKGRTEYDFSFFRARNHMTLYHISLGLMELLQPYIFRSEYNEPLHEALTCYFDMINAYFGRRESILGLIDKFMTFLHDYLEHQPQKAVLFIQEHGSKILPDLRKAMPGLVSLKQLVGTINFDSSSSAGAATGSNYSVQNRREAGNDINRFTMNLENAVVDEELAGILLDISNACTARPFILESFVNEITHFIGHSSKSVRLPAYNLLLKYLRYSPKSCDNIVPAYIGCLESTDPGVSLCALEKLPDVCVLAQDRMSHILQTAFCLGLYSAHTNVTQYIVETVNVMNVQEGY